MVQGASMLREGGRVERGKEKDLLLNVMNLGD